MRVLNKRFIKMVSITLLVALIAAMVPMLSQPEVAEAQAWPARVVYNIYATDGWVQMADGAPLYIYGFVGGREGEPLTYQNYGINAGGAQLPPYRRSDSHSLSITPAEQAWPQSPASCPLICSDGRYHRGRLKNLGVHMGTPVTQ